jgi:hypothetical protein
LENYGRTIHPDPEVPQAVPPKTLLRYQCSFKAFKGATTSKEAINGRIIELRELRCVNAYLRWLHEGTNMVRSGFSALKKSKRSSLP